MNVFSEQITEVVSSNIGQDKVIAVEEDKTWIIWMLQEKKLS